MAGLDMGLPESEEVSFAKNSLEARVTESHTVCESRCKKPGKIGMCQVMKNFKSQL